MDKKNGMNPVTLLKDYWLAAKNNNDDLAGLCVFTTVDESNFPHSRIIELKEIEDDRISILINNTSPKWYQLNFNKKYEVLIYWHSVPFQARISGNFINMENDKSENFWKKQPYNFRILDMYYTRCADQSRVIESKINFKNEIESLKEAFPPNSEFDMPGTVQGIYLVPNRVEFWHGSHDFKIPERVLFCLERNGWKEEILIP